MSDSRTGGRALNIDIRELIAAKNPELAGKIPGTFVRMLERLLHVREINGILSRGADLDGVDFIEQAMEDFGVEIRISGAENLSGLERPVIVSNHPLGGMDGMALLALMSRYFPEVRVLVNDFLLAIPNLRGLFVPVNKLGDNRRHQQRYRELYASPAAILHFPAGLCSRRKGGVIKDLPWNRSYVRLARDNNRPVVPVFFSGSNRKFFYDVANLRRWFGIGFNIEMLFLADEMFRQKGQVLEARVGNAVSPSELRTGGVNEWNRRIRRRVYDLGTEVSS